LKDSLHYHEIGLNPSLIHHSIDNRVDFAIFADKQLLHLHSRPYDPNHLEAIPLRLLLEQARGVLPGYLLYHLMILEDSPEFKVELGKVRTTHDQLFDELFKACDLHLSVGVDHCQDGARFFWLILTIAKVQVPITCEDTLLDLRLLREN